MQHTPPAEPGMTTLKRDDGLPAQVAQRILQRILARELLPGAVLPSEREIGESFGVSRPVAREAIKLLAARGIVAIHPRQGATVGLDLTGAMAEALTLAFHQENVVQEDLLNARVALEPHIATLAAASATPMQLRRARQMGQMLQDVLAQLEAGNLEGALRLWNEHDAQFHILLAEMSQNPVFKILIAVIDGVLWRQTQAKIAPMSAEHLRGAATQHLAIAQAVLAGDGAAAAAAMSEHLEFTRSHIMLVQNTLQQPVRVQLE